MSATSGHRFWFSLTAVGLVTFGVATESEARGSYGVSTLADAQAPYNEGGSASYNNEFTNSSYGIFTTNSGSASGTTDTTGLVTSSYDTAYASSHSEGQNVYPGLFGSASASANLADGTVHTYASANGLNNNSVQTGLFANSDATANAGFKDTLHFSIAGANSSTITYIRVFYSVAGTFQAYNPGNNYAVLHSFLGLGPSVVETNVETINNGALGITQSDFSNFESGSGFTQLTTNDLTFEGTFALHGASDTEQLSFFVDSQATNGVLMDLTGQVSLGLSTGVTFTSDSGVFLTASAVPEPASLTMAGIGGAICLFVYRRRRARMVS